MNSAGKGFCWTNAIDEGMYPILTDSRGNSVLTGEGSVEETDRKNFTVEELEVFLVKN